MHSTHRLKTLAMAGRANFALWQAIRAGDASTASSLLAGLPDERSWLLENGDGAVALARGSGFQGLAELLRGAKMRALATDERAVALERELREQVTRARTSAAAVATASKLMGDAKPLVGGSNGALGVAIDPLRRMMRDQSDGELSTWRSSLSGASSHRSSDRKSVV